MRTALVQTKQNLLYHFIHTGLRFSSGQAQALRDEMVGQTFSLARQAVGRGCDLIVTTEAVNFCGQPSALPGRYEDYLPQYPGDPLFRRLSALAKEAGAWLVAGAYNRRQGLCYNSAFIYDRGGRLVDIYDKIHLAGTENDVLIPGERCVVVDTDMGKLGVAVCYDMQFPDVCARCHERGAQFMAVPTWGWEHGYGLERIRETGLKLAAAMAVPYWMPIIGPRYPSELLDGAGNVLAAADRENAGVLIGEL